jgi:hypothetical protein
LQGALAPDKPTARYKDRLALYGFPEISGHECRFDLGHIIGASLRGRLAGLYGFKLLF